MIFHGCRFDFKFISHFSNLIIVINISNDISFSSAVLLCFRLLREIYHLWTLAGGDVFAELKKHDLIKTFPPVCNMPK